jgi:hypothetical protein
LKLILTFAAAAALTAGPALAQSSGFKPFGVTSSAPGSTYKRYGQAPSTAGRPKTYGPPAAGGGFKPYEPFKPGSVYAAPKSPSYGAKPCETSVYVNACDKRR